MVDRISFLFFLFILLAACNNSTIEKKETDFAVEDTAVISKIVIIDDVDTLFLNKIGGQWFVNNTYEANKKMIERMLNTVSLIQMKTPLPDNAVEEINEQLKKTGKHIIIYGKNGKILKSYKLGKFVKGSGNYIKLDDASVPYVAFIPSYDFDLGKNFPLKEKLWQNKVLFSLSSDRIESVYFENYKTGDKFYLQQSGGKFFIAKEKTSQQKSQINSDVAEYYLSHFSHIEFETFLEEVDEKVMDSLQNSMPVFVLEVEKNDGHEINLRAYDFVIDGKSDKNRFMALLNEKDLIIAKYYDFDLIMKDYKYFLKE